MMRAIEKARVKELIKSGLRYDQVTEILNKEGLKTPRGKEWTNGTVSYYARNVLKHRKRGKGKSARVGKTGAAAGQGIKVTVKGGAITSAKDKKVLTEVLQSNLSAASKLTLIEHLMK